MPAFILCGDYIRIPHFGRPGRFASMTDPDRGSRGFVAAAARTGMAGTPFWGPAGGGCFFAGAASDSAAGAVAAVVIAAAAAGWLGPVTGFLGSVALILTT